MNRVTKITKENAPHYKWGNNCDGWHLLNEQSLSIIRECMPAGTSEQAHFHSMSQQLFYILDGEATFVVGEETILLGAGESLHIKPNTTHLILNNSNTSLHFLVISQPRAQGDRINADKDRL